MITGTERQSPLADVPEVWAAIDDLNAEQLARHCDVFEHDGFEIRGIFPEQNSLEMRARFTILARKKKLNLIPRMSSTIVLIAAAIGFLDFAQAAWHVLKVMLPRLVFFSIFVATCFGQELVDAPRPSIIPQRTANFSERVFWSSIAAQQMATAFDGWTTMRMQKMGHHEASFPEGWQEIYGRNPSLLRYAAISEGFNAAEAIAARAMMHSRHRWLRATGFVLLNEQTAEHLEGGFHNLGLRPVRGGQ